MFAKRLELQEEGVSSHGLRGKRRRRRQRQRTRKEEGDDSSACWRLHHQASTHRISHSGTEHQRSSPGDAPDELATPLHRKVSLFRQTCAPAGQCVGKGRRDAAPEAPLEQDGDSRRSVLLVVAVPQTRQSDQRIAALQQVEGNSRCAKVDYNPNRSP